MRDQLEGLRKKTKAEMELEKALERLRGSDTKKTQKKIKKNKK